MLINTTKTTIQATKIAISYNNNIEYNSILKIITIFRLMKLNVVFEPIEIAGDNYKKNINNGIDEGNLTHLMNTNFLFHTPFNYENFNKSTQIKLEKYLNFALEIYFTRYYKILDSGRFFLKTKLTEYIEKDMKYIQNIDDFNDIIDDDIIDNDIVDDDITKNYDFLVSFGNKYAIFELKNTNDKTIIHFVCEFLHFVNLQDYGDKIKNFQKIDDVIQYCRKTFFENREVGIKEIKNTFLSKVDSIRYNIEIKDDFMEDFKKNLEFAERSSEFIKIKLNETYIISQIVNTIKEKKVILPESFELYQILSNNIEFYPNINFWSREVVKPVIVLKRIEKY